MIKIQVLGNLTRDCMLGQVNGKSVINFTVAHNEKYKDQTGNTIEKVAYCEAAYWTEKTGIAPFLKKGTKVYVEGTPEVKAYTTKDGKNGASLVIRVREIQLLGGSSEQQPMQQESTTDVSESLPF